MKGTKMQKGITLIALIITIIVLLILAVVAIGSMQESDIIKHAENSVNEYNIAIRKEEGLLNSYVNFINEHIEKEQTKTGIEYYYDSGYMMLQKIDWDNSTITTYLWKSADDITHQGHISVVFSKLESDTIISDEYTLKAGAIKCDAQIDGVTATAYVQDDKMYFTDGEGDIGVLKLVTDQDKIEEFETSIEGIQ